MLIGRVFLSSDEFINYRIRPNYRTVRLGFSKLLGTLIVVKYTIKGTFKKKSEKDVFDDYANVCLIVLKKAYVVGTHLNCIDKSMQFK